MPYAVTHVILTIILVDIYRDYFAKKKFPLFYIIVAGIGGLLPDIDLPLQWISQWILGYPLVIHGQFHMAIIPVILILLTLLLYKIEHKHYLMPAMLAFGYLFHLIIDVIAGEYRYIFLPFSDKFAGFGLIPIEYFSGIDAVILLVWLCYMYRKHNIKDFI